MYHRYVFLICLFSLIFGLEAAPEKEFPVLYKGRYRPAEAYAQLWMQDRDDAAHPKREGEGTSHSPLALLWIYETSEKEQRRKEEAFMSRFQELKDKAVAPREISSILEREFPISQRLYNSSSLFLSLPSRLNSGEWLPLHALTIKTFDAKKNDLTLVSNFTVYPDEQFTALQAAYVKMQRALQEHSPHLENVERELSQLLYDSYASSLAGHIYQPAHGKQLTYPSMMQLKAERLFISFPWIPLLITLYCIAALTLFSANNTIRKIGFSILISAFIIHSALLGLRIYILERPPVSNMFETVIYVPWVALAAVFAVPFFRKQTLILSAAALSSAILLILIKVTNLHHSLDQVQAVLDSQFWLTTHVLMVVGSYGLFLLASLLGHFYLVITLIRNKSAESLSWLAQRILQILYAGTLCLITGTILGGIWAAESWGRFWDWDPKESWAFISSCLYLIWIHAYRFRKIGDFGLAIGAVAGFLAISFTWYGVNYLLGTGLHTYGFGTGGESIYYLFCAAELIFINGAIWRHHKLSNYTG
jgi:ABC-type transport system involved in cytochrome c biogenesis permease subunit